MIENIYNFTVFGNDDKDIVTGATTECKRFFKVENLDDLLVSIRTHREISVDGSTLAIVGEVTATRRDRK